ncbi:hypothetical protein [Rhizobium leguminosarum]|uniref:hypothetical protein n=1 Tax=Rhizobium leguminosarum TaxID=384 RepID=UPI001036FB38|nr:hypothetical protein [Rhizobium leguminosarum]TBF85697.1 hypothetical protein ELG85_37190 [Rhizobium leguminosarum]
MTTDTLSVLKKIAKRLARAQRLQHIAALELVARELGKPNWRGLAESYKQGWRPSSEQIDALDKLRAPAVAKASPLTFQEMAQRELGEGLSFTRWVPDNVEPMDADEIYGVLDGQVFYMSGDEFSVAIGAQGWEITLDQPPSAKPEFRRINRRGQSASELDQAFIDRASQLLKIRALRMHAEVASDWPRRSTMPDQHGRVQHPIGGGLASKWFCLHCDGEHSGRTMAENLWHCTACGASPIDMFAAPFWNGVPEPEPADAG